VKRWVCPLCGSGKLAPGKPARDDARRFCLPCSGKTGKLVERVSPAAQRAAAEREERRVAAAERGRARRASRSLQERERAAAEAEVYPGVLRVLLRRWARLNEWGADLRDLKMSVRRRADAYSTGHAYYRAARITLTVGTSEGDGYATLLHEMAHHAGHRRPGPARIDGHGHAYYRMLARAGEEVLGRKLELPGPADRRVNEVLAVAFQEEVAAGRLPAYGPGKPRPRVLLTPIRPMPVVLPEALRGEVRDVLDCMRIEATDEETEEEAVLEAGAADWCRDLLEENGWRFLPVHPSAAGMWQRIARALNDRALNDLGESADLPGLRRLASGIWRAIGDPRGD